MAWIDPVTNRSPIDIARVIQEPQMLEQSIGARNTDSLNRIASNSVELRNILVDRGYSPPALKQKMLWVESDLPYRAYIQNIIDDVNMLRGYAPSLSADIETPELPLNTFWKMNDLEKIISGIWMALAFVISLFVKDDGYLYSEISDNLQQYCEFDIVDNDLKVKYSGPLLYMQWGIDSSGNAVMIGELA